MSFALSGGGLLVFALVSSCARPKETTPSAVGPPADDGAPICTALAARGPLAERFATIFPLDRGGSLFVLGPAGTEPVARALEPFGLREARVIGCQPDSVVLFIPAVDSRGAEKIEERLLAVVPKSRVREKLMAPPRGPSQQETSFP
ncbi:MAG TPA: hypothetical protein VGP07_05865 [Polyangia bacterium]